MNVPKIRFSEFVNEWDLLKMSDITKINQGLQIEISKRFTESAPNRYFYITNQFLKNDSKEVFYIENPSPNVICNKDDILMTRTGNTGKVLIDISGCFHNNFFKIDYNRELVNKYFLYYILTSNKIQKTILNYAGTSTIPDLNHSDFYRIKSYFPTLKEQIKISNFLSLLDKKIELQTKKIEVLKLFKKGLINRLFNEYDYETKKIKDVLNFEQPNKYIVDSDDYIADSTAIPVLTANKGFILGYCNEMNFYDKGDSIIFDDFTMDLKYTSFKYKIKSSAIKILTAKENNNLKYIYEVLLSLNLKSEEHKRHYITYVQELDIKVPSYVVQEKIANISNLYDSKLDLEILILSKLQELKKGLMQGMFV